MKFLAALGIGAVAAASIGQSVRLTNDKGEGIEQTYDFSYSTRHETTIVGAVVGKVKGDPENGVAESMAILVKTRAGKTYSVDLGPTWYVSDQATSIKIGDKVKVVGEPIVMASTKSNVDKFIVARQIIEGHRVLALRDPAGYPYWSAVRKGRVAVMGTKNSVTGQIVSENPVTAENQQQAGYQLQTSNGLLNIAVAPNWYLEQQNLGFHVGDQITVYTGIGPVAFGDHIILANGIYGNGGTVILRPNGIPVWGGWSN